MYQDIIYIYIYIYVYLTDIYYSNWVYSDKLATLSTCAMVKSRYIGDKLIPPLMTESLVDGCINPYEFRVDFSYPLLYGNNGS